MRSCWQTMMSLSFFRFITNFEAGRNTETGFRMHDLSNLYDLKNICFIKGEKYVQIDSKETRMASMTLLGLHYCLL